MSSSQSREQLFDPIRAEWIAATPEEQVRQRLIAQLLERGYPRSLLSVETALHQLPHISNQSAVPDRRADLICFGNQVHPDHALYPLLLIECKAVPLTEAVKRQATGYNHYVGAYFVAVANAQALETGWWDAAARDYQWVGYLPNYQQLIESIS